MQKLLKNAKAVLENPNIRKIVASRPFDEAVCWYKYGIKIKGEIHDVLEMAHLIDENYYSYSLENISNIYTDLKNIKNISPELYDGQENLTEEKLIAGQGVDSDASLRCFNVLAKEINKDKKLLRYYRKFILPAQNMFSDIYFHGCKIDINILKKNEQEAVSVLSDLHQKAVAELPYKLRKKHENKININGDFSKQGVTTSSVVLDFLFLSKDGLGLIPHKDYLTMKTKVPQNTEKHLKQFKNIPFVKYILEYKEVYKLYTSYLKTLWDFIQKDGYIYPTTYLNKTVTGRPIMLRPPIQTYPQHGKYAYLIKKSIIAEDGWVLGSRDLSQSEMAIAGWLAGDKNILNTVNAGINIHKKTASIINKIPIEKVTDEIKQKAKCFHPDVEVLTKKGWVSFNKYNGQDEILQAIPLNNKIKLEWTKPIYFNLEPNHKNTLCCLYNEGINISVTPDHRMLGQKNNGDFYIIKPKDFNKVRRWYNAGILEKHKNTFHINENYLRLAIATQADGSIVYSKKDNRPLRIRFGFTKKRKIYRIKNLLKGLKYKKSIRSSDKNKKVTFFVLYEKDVIKILKYLDKDKTFSWNMLNYPIFYREVILDELQYWDSGKYKKWIQFKYGSVIRKNIDIIQAIACISNRKSRLTTEKKINNKFNCFTLSIKKYPYSRGGNVNFKEIPYKHNVAVISVSSSFILVRSGGNTLITGQSFNFGFIFGMAAVTKSGEGGFKKYAKDEFGLDFTEKQCYDFRNKFFSKPDGYYMLPIYHEKQKQFARKYGYVESPLGRKRRLPDIQSDNWGKRSYAERQAVNLPIQSFSSDLALIGMFLFNAEISTNMKYKNKVKPMFFIYDSILFRAKEDIFELAMLLLKDCMENRSKEYIKNNFRLNISYKIASEGKTGTNWADMKNI